MSNTKVWLCNYSNFELLDIYDIEISIPEVIDAKNLYKYDKKCMNKELSQLEKTEHKKLLNLVLKEKNNWLSAKYKEPETMPNRLYKKPNSSLPAIDEVAFCITDGYLIVNKLCYEIMSRHNLGKTHFSQVRIYDIETEEKISDVPYYFINIAETRNFINATESQGIQGIIYKPNSSVRFISEPKDNDIILNDEAKECDVDLWHDPVLIYSLFLSDKLVQALLIAGIGLDSLSLVSCQS